MAVQNPTKFLKEVQEELKKVAWPSRRQTAKLTTIVAGVSVVVGVFIGILDFVFTKIMEIVIK